MVGQKWYVFLAFAQRRCDDGKARQAVVEILAKSALLNLLRVYSPLLAAGSFINELLRMGGQAKKG